MADGKRLQPAGWAVAELGYGTSDQNVASGMMSSRDQDKHVGSFCILHEHVCIHVDTDGMSRFIYGF